MASHNSENVAGSFSFKKLVNKAGEITVSLGDRISIVGMLSYGEGYSFGSHYLSISKWLS